MCRLHSWDRDKQRDVCKAFPFKMALNEKFDVFIPNIQFRRSKASRPAVPVGFYCFGSER